MTTLVLDDILALGAQAMPDAALVHILIPDVGRARAEFLTQALMLDPRARAEVLRHEHEGPRLLAALELGRRAAVYPARGGIRIRGPSDVVETALPRLPVDVERVLVLALDSRLHLARVIVTGEGTTHVVDAPFAHVLGPVLAAGCARFVIAHRHLDGCAEASIADHAATLQLATAAASLGLALVDHVILGDDGFVSLRRDGRLPATRGYR
jgi:DNA repair protein RadC